MKPNVSQRQPHETVAEPPSCIFGEQLGAARLEQLSILNSSGTDRFASATTKTAIYVKSERRRVAGKFSFGHGAHEIDAPARAVVFVTS